MRFKCIRQTDLLSCGSTCIQMLCRHYGRKLSLDFINEQVGLTNIGALGLNLSQGQKQRILIARALYKNPEMIIFDEATSSLDSINENRLMENIFTSCNGKTVVLIAHRLSTIKNADQIIVIDQGSIVEKGTHCELLAKNGIYYHLVKNQLEFGTCHYEYRR